MLVMEKYPHLFNHKVCKGLYVAAKRQLIKQRQDKHRVNFSGEDKDFLLSDRRVNDGPLSHKQLRFIQATVDQWNLPVFQQAFKIKCAFPFVAFNGFLDGGFIYDDSAKEFVKMTVRECEAHGWILNLLESYDVELQEAIYSLGVAHIHHNPQTFKKFLQRVKEPKLREHLEKTQTELLSFIRFKSKKVPVARYQAFIRNKKALWSYAYNIMLAELKTVKEYKGRTRSI